MKMKHYAATTLAVVSLFACQSQETENNTYQPIELDTKSAAVVTSNNQMGMNLFKALSANGDKNLFISPLSVSQALSMTWNGAAGQTAAEMATVLGYETVPGEINPSSKTIREALLQADNTIDFSIANSIWYNNGYAIEADFEDTTSEYFDAQIDRFDPANGSRSLATINGWVSDHTKGKITKILDSIEPENMMFLINAIYFKGQWQSKFDKGNTSSQPFQNLSGNASTVDMMMQETDLGYASTSQCTAVEIPYGNGHFTMVVMLPNDGIGINDLVASITPDSWQTLTESFISREVQLYLPKFKIENDLTLNETLEALGMPRAFSDSAEFPNMITDASLRISKVKHKTFVEVNEEGTEAAAVTSVTMDLTSVGPDEPEVFRVDRPFVFAIREKDTGAIVFIGKIVGL